jgi:chemotaxis signal transduction protein
MTTRIAPAWLLEYADGRFAAFGLHATLALVETPEFIRVPGAPPHALGLMRWNAWRIPLLDLGLLGGWGRQRDPAAPSHALVLAWHRHGMSQAALGALAADRLVSMIEVRDAQQCHAPADAGMLGEVADTWFEHRGYPVAVVDTARLFGGAEGSESERVDELASSRGDL